VELPTEIPVLEGEVLDSFRIRNGVPAWGRELTEGLLPTEAGLNATDISYQKGCYIGQEVISRIKSAGKVNKRLVRMTFASDVPVEGTTLVDPDGQPAGALTSISAHGENGLRHALGFVKRGVDEVFIKAADGTIHPARTMPLKPALD
jgi:folate-binding protein YgfZ